jgi:HEAT repeat protein
MVRSAPIKTVEQILSALFIALLVAYPVGAYPGPAVNLDNLIAEASLIAVGQIVSVEEVGKTTVALEDRNVQALEMVAELRVDQVLKGTIDGPSSSLRLHYAIPDVFVGWRSIAPLSYRMFFLVESPGGFKLVSPYYPSAVAIQGAKIQHGTASERVMDELGAVLESTTTPVEERREAVFALSISKSPAAIRALKRVAEVKDVTLRLSVAAALIEKNDISTLEFAEDALLKPDPALPPHLYLLHNLSSAISEGLRDERAVHSLTKLVHADSAETRRAAASALMHVGSTSCIDPLLSALNDPDLDVRYYSVVGLAEITAQTDWRPNMDDFTSDQQRYLNHWKDWAKNR